MLKSTTPLAIRESSSGQRYAIYFAPPPESALYRFGSAWLGRNAVTGAELPPPPLNGLTEKLWRRVTAGPSLYGFHAPLKPPFHLSRDRTKDDLVASVDCFAKTVGPFDAPPLRLARLSSVIALVPHEESPALVAFAEACVREFEPFRAPLAPEDFTKRQAAQLTPRQLELLTTWGYPYVLDEWLFHMTLASGVDGTDADRLCAILAPLVQSHTKSPLRIDSVSIFEQPAPQVPFRVIARFPFANRRQRTVLPLCPLCPLC